MDGRTNPNQYPHNPSEVGGHNYWEDIQENERCVTDLFSSPEHIVLIVSYCDQSMSVVRRATCVVNNLLLKLTLPEPFGQCGSNFLGGSLPK